MVPNKLQQTFFMFHNEPPGIYFPLPDSILKMHGVNYNQPYASRGFNHIQYQPACLTTIRLWFTTLIFER